MIENSKKEERKNVKDLIENQIRGKYIGCEFKIQIQLSDGRIFSNFDYFKNSSEIDAGVTPIQINLIKNDSSETLVAKMSNTTSFIKISDDSRKDYQSRMIEIINRELKINEFLTNMFEIINHLRPIEISIIILHGVMDFDYTEITEKGGSSSKRLQRIYTQALDKIAMVLNLKSE